MRKAFNISWLIYFTIVIITPASSIESNYNIDVIGLQLLFILMGNIILINLPFPINEKESNDIYSLTINKTSILVMVAYIGIISFIIDKVFYRGLSFSTDLASLRYALNDRGDSASASSIFSILGYLLTPVSFILLLIGIFNFHLSKYSKSLRFIVTYILPSVLSVGVISFFTGGRSSILVYIALVSICIIYRKYYNPLTKINIRVLILAAIIGTATVSYSLQVFADRAKANNIELRVYAHSLIERLGGKPRNVDLPDFVDENTYYLVLSSLTYIAHNQWTSAQIIANKQRPGQVFFNQWRNLLSKVGFISKNKDGWLYSGAFISIPVGLYYDFGLIGMILISLFYFLAYRYVYIKLMLNRSKYLWHALFILLSLILLLSPYAIVTDFLIFPLATIALLSFALLSLSLNYSKLSE